MKNISGNANWNLNDNVEKSDQPFITKQGVDFEKVKDSKKLILKLLKDAKKETEKVYRFNKDKHINDSLIHINTSITNIEKIELS